MSELEIGDNIKEVEITLNGVARMFGQDVYWAFKKMHDYKRGLFSYAKFRVGDRVQLTRAPVISGSQSWGWQGSEHFLVAGSKATVASRDWGGEFTYAVVFDDESWKDRDGVVHPKKADERHTYCFSEDMLEAAKP